MTTPTQRVAPIIDIAGTRFPPLDGIRGIAVLLVMLFHFGLAYETLYTSNVFIKSTQFGWLGVDLFFVLSGLLITSILLDTKDSSHYFRSFLGRRFLRIWPLYYLNLLIFLVIAPLVLTNLPQQLATMQDKQIWFWLYGANWLFAIEGSFEQTPGGYFWSLAVEEQFYVLWPFVVYKLSNNGLLKTSIGLFAASLILRLVLFNLGVSTNSLYVITFTHLDSLAAGAALAVLLRNDVPAATIKPWAQALMIVSALGLAAVALLDGNGLFWNKHMATYGYSFAALLFVGFCATAVTSKPTTPVNRLLGTPVLTLIGKYSYALYLLHVPIANVLEAILLKRLEPLIGYTPAYITFFVCALLTSVFCAYLSWNLLEKHLLSLKRFFPY